MFALSRNPTPEVLRDAKCLGGATTFKLLARSSDATIQLPHGLGFGWGGWGNNVQVTCKWLGVWVGWGNITYKLLAHSSDVTLQLRHGSGFGLLARSSASTLELRHDMAWGFGVVGQ